LLNLVCRGYEESLGHRQKTVGGELSYYLNRRMIYITAGESILQQNIIINNWHQGSKNNNLDMNWMLPSGVITGILGPFDVGLVHVYHLVRLDMYKHLSCMPVST
jgi:hypothetical protein